MSSDLHDIDTAEFMALRPRLFAVAYRMLGTVSDAEDIAQECFLRWQQTQRDEVADARGFLIRVATNLCLDRLRAAKTLRETYPGEWLPEPILTDDPTDRTDHDVSVALLLALERLTPLERAAYLLRDVFDAEYSEVSEVLKRSPATCRKLVTRARSHVHEARPRSTVSPAESEAITLAFFDAARTGDTDTLSRVLAEGAQVVTDGGGKVTAARNAILGRNKAIRFFAGIARKQGDALPDVWRFCYINGLPSILSYETKDGLVQATMLEVEEGRVCQIYIVRNPEKTAHLAAELNVSSASK